MNSQFSIFNGEDLSSYDLGTPDVLANWSVPTKEKSNENNYFNQDLYIFIEPTVSATFNSFTIPRNPTIMIFLFRYLHIHSMRKKEKRFKMS